MTIATTLNRIEYTASGGQSVFPYTFLIFANTDLEVYQEGTLLTLTTHYTVSGVGDAGGGNVTLVTGATADDEILIVRVMPVTQLVDYVENDSFPADTHETALDRLTMIAQQLQETLGRAIKLPITSTLEDIDIPLPGGGKHLAWNSGGTALELVTVSESAIASPIAVKGDIIQGDASGDPEKLAIGTALQFARVSSGDKVEWVSEPITTKGDVLRGATADGAPERLAVGSNGQLLGIASGQVAWENKQSVLETGTWSDVSESRAVDTVYQNTSGKKKRIALSWQIETGGAVVEANFQVGSANPPTVKAGRLIYSSTDLAGSIGSTMFTEVPDNWYYRFETTTATSVINEWLELDE